VTNLAQLRRNLAGRLTGGIVSVLAKTPLTPTALTWIGFIISLIAAFLIARDSLLAAGIVVLVGGSFDMMDGALARLTDRVTRFGAVLDSTLDRLSEAALLIGVMVLWASGGDTGGVLLAGVTLSASLVVSYLRSRAEVLGLECKSGLFTRPERVIVLALGLLINQLMIALLIIAALSIVTVLQRLSIIRRQLKN
jgi:CDP-diacylglycerol--glycerol-3-phosphate 3-phosphatidyltransferase